MEKSRKWTGWILIASILLITVITLAASALSDGPAQTDDPLQNDMSILRQLFPQAAGTGDAFEQLDDGKDGFICRVRQAGGDCYAAKQTEQGYAGPVEVITAIDGSGMILGIHVGGSEFRETEGLGGKARDAAFTDQFRQKKTPLSLGQDIDAITGATVTSQAVVDAVNHAAERLGAMEGVFRTSDAAVMPEASDLSGMTANASAIGYGGPVLVRLTLDNEGRISSLDVGGARFSETEGVGSRVREGSFTEQFLGLVPPLELNRDVDAVTGATVSSRAVVEAVNDAAAFLSQNSSPNDTN